MTDIAPTDAHATHGHSAAKMAAADRGVRAERARRRLLDALLGGGAALCLITAAHAALPRFGPGPLLSPPKPVQVVRRAPAPPAAPPPFLAFQDPEPGYAVVSPFGLRQLPWEASGRLHAGIDIAAPAGLPVLAAADGVVTRMEADAGYGRFVEIRHAGGLSTLYAHLARFEPQIAVGMTVKSGAPVGELGSTGSSTGAHLHFEVHDDQGRPLNPALFLGRSFASADDLPLRAAARIPRGVRVAHVSSIPKARREEMQARLDEAAASNAAADAASATLADLSPNAAGAAADASAVVARNRYAHGRPHGRLRLRE